MNMGHWIGFDPGSSKCGLVRTDISGQQVQDLLVCTPQESWDWLQHWCQSSTVSGLVPGDGGRATSNCMPHIMGSTNAML